MIEMLAAEDPPQTFNWTLIIVGFLGSGALTAFLTLMFNRRKDNAETVKSEAEAADLIQRASAALIQQVQDQARISLDFQVQQNAQLVLQIEGLRAQVADLQEVVGRIPGLETEISELTKGIAMLTEQVRGQGLTPVYPPADS